MLKKIFLYSMVLTLVSANYGLFWLFSDNFPGAKEKTETSFSKADIPLVKAKATFLDSGPLPEGSIKIISQGDFISQKEQPVTGAALLIAVGEKKYIHLNNDFTLEKNQDLKIFLAKENSSDPKTELGKIKISSGSQNYEIPDNIDLEEYTQIIIEGNEHPLAQANLEKEI